MKEKSNELTTIEEKALIFIDPNKAINLGIEMSKVLTKVVESAGLASSFGGKKKHLMIEAWQFLGKANNMTARTVWTKPYIHENRIIGYDAYVEILQDGKVVGGAESSCNKDEENWAKKPAFQLKSMAQTRAEGKAFRSILAWIVALSGYATTPAEEMMVEEMMVLENKKKQSQEKVDEQINQLKSWLQEMETVSGISEMDLLKTFTANPPSFEGFNNLKALKTVKKNNEKQFYTIFNKIKKKYEEFLTSVDANQPFKINNNSPESF